MSQEAQITTQPRPQPKKPSDPLAALKSSIQREAKRLAAKKELTLAQLQNFATETQFPLLEDFVQEVMNQRAWTVNALRALQQDQQNQFQYLLARIDEVEDGAGDDDFTVSDDEGSLVLMVATGCQLLVENALEHMKANPQQGNEEAQVRLQELLGYTKEVVELFSGFDEGGGDDEDQGAQA